MEAAVYDLPLASVPTRKPRTPIEVPIPDLDRFKRSGPSLMLLRKRHAMSRQFYPRSPHQKLSDFAKLFHSFLPKSFRMSIRLFSLTRN